MSLQGVVPTTPAAKGRKEAVRGRKGQRQGAGPSLEETAMWTGATKDNQDVTVCQASLKHVSREVESQMFLLKSARKAREERVLAGRDAWRSRAQQP